MPKITNKEIADIRDYVTFNAHIDYQNNLYRILDRLEVLESAVAFKGFDELPEMHEKIEVKMSNGDVLTGTRTKLLWDFEDYATRKISAVGWRYAIGDLSK